MARKFYNLSTTTSRNVFNGNGVTTAFPLDFAFIASASLKVTLVAANGTETPQIENTHYTVSGGLNSDGEPDTGTVTMATAPASGARLVVDRNEGYVQPSTFQRFGRIPIKVVELALDRVTLLTQQLLDLSNRTLRYPSSEPLATSGTLPSLDTRKGKLLKFNATTGVPEAAAVADAGTEISIAMVPVVQAANVAAARVLLGADFGVTVTSFGADKTGVADSTAAFQAAVDSGAGYVFVPKGNYKLATAVNITAPVTIVGAGGDHTFSAAGGSNLGFGDGSNHFFTVNAHNVTLIGLNFHGDGGGNRNTAGACAVVVGSNGTELANGLAITSGTAAVVGTGTNFQAGDIGKRIFIAGAGAAGEPLQTTITAVADATHLTVADNAGTTVANAAGRYGHTYLGFRAENVTTNAFHDAGISFVNAAHFTVDACTLKGTKAAIRIQNRVAVDYGDSMISDSTLYSGATGKCIEWLSSGGLKVDTCKFLDGQYHIHMTWNEALSGNFNVTNCSFENYTVTSIYMTGSKSFTRANIVGNTFGGGGTAIEVAGAATWLKMLNITGNTMSIGTAVPAIAIDRTNIFDIKANTIDGNSIATFGVTVTANASNGLIGRNNFANLASGETSISSTSTAKEYETGDISSSISLTFATPGNLNVVYVAKVVRYVKCGRKVAMQLSFSLSTFTHTTASGNLTISGIPSTLAAANALNNHAVGSMTFSGITKAGYTQFAPYINPNGTSLLVLASGSGQALSAVTAADMPTGGTVDLRMAIEYEAKI